MAGGKVMDVEGLIPLGWYTAFICLAAEIMVLSQLGNMFYMAYAGFVLVHGNHLGYLGNSKLIK